MERCSSAGAVNKIDQKAQLIFKDHPPRSKSSLSVYGTESPFPTLRFDAKRTSSVLSLPRSDSPQSDRGSRQVLSNFAVAPACSIVTQCQRRIYLVDEEALRAKAKDPNAAVANPPLQLVTKTRRVIGHLHLEDLLHLLESKRPPSTKIMKSASGSATSLHSAEHVPETGGKGIPTPPSDQRSIASTTDSIPLSDFKRCRRRRCQVKAELWSSQESISSAEPVVSARSRSASAQWSYTSSQDNLNFSDEPYSKLMRTRSSHDWSDMYQMKTLDQRIHEGHWSVTHSHDDISLGKTKSLDRRSKYHRWAGESDPYLYRHSMRTATSQPTLLDQSKEFDSSEELESSSSESLEGRRPPRLVKREAGTQTPPKIPGVGLAAAENVHLSERLQARAQQLQKWHHRPLYRTHSTEQPPTRQQRTRSGGFLPDVVMDSEKGVVKEESGESPQKAKKLPVTTIEPEVQSKETPSSKEPVVLRKRTRAERPKSLEGSNMEEFTTFPSAASSLPQLGDTGSEKSVAQELAPTRSVDTINQLDSPKPFPRRLKKKSGSSESLSELSSNQSLSSSTAALSEPLPPASPAMTPQRPRKKKPERFRRELAAARSMENIRATRPPRPAPPLSWSSTQSYDGLNSVEVLQEKLRHQLQEQQRLKSSSRATGGSRAAGEEKAEPGTPERPQRRIYYKRVLPLEKK